MTPEETKSMENALPQPPEYKERYEKVAPFIKILEMWAEGYKIEAQSKIQQNKEWRKLPENPGWSFNYNEYRVVRKQNREKKSILATEEDHTAMQKFTFAKDRNTGKIYTTSWDEFAQLTHSHKRYLIYNPDTKCWEDWGE